MCQAVRISKKFTALLTLSFYNYMYKKFDNYFLIWKCEALQKQNYFYF